MSCSRFNTGVKVFWQNINILMLPEDILKKMTHQHIVHPFLNGRIFITCKNSLKNTQKKGK